MAQVSSAAQQAGMDAIAVPVQRLGQPGVSRSRLWARPWPGSHRGWASFVDAPTVPVSFKPGGPSGPPQRRQGRLRAMNSTRKTLTAALTLAIVSVLGIGTAASAEHLYPAASPAASVNAAAQAGLPGRAEPGRSL
jgi:hypothetical protein